MKGLGTMGHHRARGKAGSCGQLENQDWREDDQYEWPMARGLVVIGGLYLQVSGHGEGVVFDRIGTTATANSDQKI